jgi:hypothetical protein
MFIKSNCCLTRLTNWCLVEKMKKKVVEASEKIERGIL